MGNNRNSFLGCAVSTGYQASRAKGSKGGCRDSKCRHPATMDRALFEKLRDAAMANARSISEEMAERLAGSFRANERQEV
jgi:hypothetical protein